MKKTLCCVLAVISVFLSFGCGTKEDETKKTDNTTLPPVSGSEETSFTAPSAEPVNGEAHKGCLYGENTGTDKTYTGLEPLPLTDFGPPSFANDKGLPETTVSHSFGVAKNGRPHEISVGFQQFFDENGYDALCYDAKTTEKILYLTFDCGYENGYTAKILDTLRDKNVTAAFFCTKPEMEQNAEIIARMVNEGHIVGNHSVRHPDFSKLTREEMYNEVKGFDDFLREHFGYSAQYFRYPQGKYNENSLDLLNQMGYTCVFWSLAYEDWDLEKQRGSDYAYETVISRLHPGAVILLHAISPDNAAALGNIIDEARAMGYEFRALYEYNA